MFKKSTPKFEITSETFDRFIAPLTKILTHTPELLSRGDRPLKMTFEDQLKALVYFHLQEHESARHLVLDMNENDFAKQNIAPEGGISRSSFSEAINHRGLDQLQYIFENLYKQASKSLPKEHKKLGDLISISPSQKSRKTISPEETDSKRHKTSPIFVTAFPSDNQPPVLSL